MQRSLKAYRGLVLSVGIYDAENAKKMAINEKGSQHIPSRPAMSSAFRDFTRSGKHRAGFSLLARISPKSFQNKKGEQLKKAVQASIRNWSSPPNAASTIRNKGFNNPLIHTSEMVNAVDFRVKGRET